MTGALVELNAEFLDGHAAARRKACERLESQALVIGYSFGMLEARWNGNVILPRKSLLPAEYHPIKDVTHGATMLVALLAGATPPDRERIAKAHAALEKVLAELDAQDAPAARLIPVAHRERQKRLLTEARAFVARLLEGGAVTAEERARYFDRIRADVRANIDAIAAVVLQQLHARVTEVRGRVQAEDPKAWSELVVVAAAVHQARADEIAVQYFERLLGEQMAEGASAERRLIVTEGVFTPSDQYGMLATHLVDMATSQLVFGDPLRLQRDVLADERGRLDRVLPRPR